MTDEEALNEELEPTFKEMQQQKRITPADKGNSEAFWAEVGKVLPEQESLFPSQPERSENDG